MKTDGIECKNYRCPDYDESMCFSCGAQTTSGDPYITICKEYMRHIGDREMAEKINPIAAFIAKNGRQHTRECPFCGTNVDFNLTDLILSCIECKARLYWEFTKNGLELGILRNGVLDPCDNDR